MLESVSRNLKMYYASQKILWKDIAIYRTQFAVWIFVFMLSTVASVVTITIIYDVSSGVAGWSYYQMLVVSSLANMMIGMVLYNISPQRLAKTMRNGQFDQHILKPYNPVFTMLSLYGTKTSIGSVISGALVFGYAAYMAGVSAIGILGIIIIFALGVVSLTMFLLMITLISYTLFNSAGYMQWVANIASRAAQYPLTIYGLPGILLFTVGLPVGLAAFYPSALVFGKISPISIVLVVVIEAFTVAVYYYACKWLVKKYRSGGG
ncbi:ABC-2 family transporter protein [Candidatus Marsarchaeota archaeon]|nr:ABC-2 family transporter protein [Candidatus Marsarchaeota archaeon]MCL5404253.1 ABC-2 family transporter protein [Candidatus Marsarchaeota archaeon]